MNPTVGRILRFTVGFSFLPFPSQLVYCDFFDDSKFFRYHILEAALDNP